MLEICKNDDQLGVVLGHEIAHVVLSHGVSNILFITIKTIGKWFDGYILQVQSLK